MKHLKSFEIRQLWIDFFKSKNHEEIPSAPLIPQNDPTLLWINAGIAPLKKYFDGREVPRNRRLVNAQKSIRTNDIDNVGRTARHHTFFEMLGNFSIGDYFREEALEWAMEFLTSEEYLGFDLDKLYFTVYPTDEESVEKWISLGVSPNHIIKIESNFWEIGEGPCGPNTEIFYDRGETYDPNKLGIKLLEEDLPNERYIEIWNIVFSQYNAKPGLSRENYPELPSKNIDTGMGLERVACVMQEVETNYDTDLFMPIINKITDLTNVKYEGQMAFKVIADHVRCVVFAVSDGAGISNEGRGYVLRRILRRAIRYGRKLNMEKPFLYELVDVVVDTMKVAYPDLEKNKERIAKLIYNEEEKFLMTLENGEKKLLDYLANAKNDVVDGAMTFLLYDTFGFPLELTIEVASEHGFRVDEYGFYEQLNRQKEMSRNARSDIGSLSTQNKDMMDFTLESNFIGYDTLETEAKIIGIFKDGELVHEASGQIILVFDKTPFYGESGGQIGDKGTVTREYLEYMVTSTIKLPNDQSACVINCGNDLLTTGDEVYLRVDRLFREDVKKNHSATHLLNAALREVLGSHVIQQGSSLNDKLLRFDFNNYNNLTDEEILQIESIVNKQINKNLEVNFSLMPLEEAKKMNVQAVFGEKYGEVVRVVDMAYSQELCGGTHVDNTSEIEKFGIISVESKGSGIFRIVASTSKHIQDEILFSLATINEEIVHLNQRANEILSEAKEQNLDLEFEPVNLRPVTDSYQSIIFRHADLANLREKVKELDKTFNKLKRENVKISLSDFTNQVKVINQTKVLISKVNDLENDILKDLIDRLADQVADVVLLANVKDEKLIFICKSKDPKVAAGKVVKEVAMITGGNGGGRPDFAQAGGKDLNKLSTALEKAYEFIEEMI